MSSVSDNDGGMALLFPRILFGRLLVALFELVTGSGDQSGNSVCVQVKMRQCKACSRKQPLEPQTVDNDYHKMRFVVSAKFVEAFVNVNLGVTETK